MDLNILIPIIFVFVGALFVILSVPLIFEKIPPNGLYGFRTEKTRSDPKAWYKVNKDFGYKMAYAGVITIICNLILFLYSNLLDITSIVIIGLLTVIVPLIILVGITLNY